MKNKLMFVGVGFLAGMFAGKALGCLSFIFWVFVFCVLYLIASCNGWI